MKKDRSKWVVKKCDSFEEMERLHITQWQAVSPSERANGLWILIVEAWKLKGGDPNELRLQRDVTSVKQRRS